MSKQLVPWFHHVRDTIYLISWFILVTNVSNVHTSPY